MSISKWIAGNLTVAVWGAILGLIIGFIGTDLESSVKQPFVFSPVSSAVMGIVVALIAVNCITYLLKIAAPKQ